MTLSIIAKSNRNICLFPRSDVSEVDEREIFKGSENRLKMTQTYTHKFQCHYELGNYPFDEQVPNMDWTFPLRMRIGGKLISDLLHKYDSRAA